MNYYKHHVGDYAADTAHLSWDEDCAYRRMIEVYYKRELPFPKSKNEIFRLVRCNTKKQKEAVDIILGEFFSLSDDGWHQKRCDEEILIAKEKAEANRVNGARGGRPKIEPRDNPGITQSVSETNPDESNARAGPLAISHKPIAINQEPVTISQEPVTKNLEPLNPTPRSKASASASREKSATRSLKVPIPADFAISDQVRTWANEHGHAELDTHLEAFRHKCMANGYSYADWDAALKEAIRSNWAGVGERVNGSKPGKPTLYERNTAAAERAREMIFGPDKHAILGVES